MNTQAVGGSERDEGRNPLNPFEEIEQTKRVWRDYPRILRVCKLAHRYLWLRAQNGHDYALPSDPVECDAFIDAQLALEADDAEPFIQGPDTQL